MKLIQDSPIRLRIQPETGMEGKTLPLHLQYVDKKVDFEIKKHKQNAHWYIQRHGESAYLDREKELKASRNKSLLFEEVDGFWTYAGLRSCLESAYKTTAKIEVKYPEFSSLSWQNKPSFTLRPYQEESVELLTKIKHGAVELSTGLGKTACFISLLRNMGLKSVVMAPSISIAQQIFDTLTFQLGKKYIGAYFGPKKDTKKLITVGVAQSLTRIEPNSDAWNNLCQSEVFIADESHLCPASTLVKVCHGLMQHAPYRFFFSGTQMRNDGLDLLLKSITGQIVYRMTVQEGVDAGYLAKPLFRIMSVETDSNYSSTDANKMTRKHLYYSNKVNRLAADLANRCINLMGRQVVILIEEIEQFSRLLPYLEHKPEFAHGGVTADNQDTVPPQYRKSDPTTLVRDFNAGKYPLLIGTSCISIGTDIQSVGAIIYLQGGKSEIQVKQAVGRGTRCPSKPDGHQFWPWKGNKEDCMFFDFDVYGNEADGMLVTSRHAAARKRIYADIYPDVQQTPKE